MSFCIVYSVKCVSSRVLLRDRIFISQKRIFLILYHLQCSLGFFPGAFTGPNVYFPENKYSHFSISYSVKWVSFRVLLEILPERYYFISQKWIFVILYRLQCKMSFCPGTFDNLHRCLFPRNEYLSFCIVYSVKWVSFRVLLRDRIFIFLEMNNSCNFYLFQLVLNHRDIVMGNLIWVSAFNGLHSFSLYVHNDTLQAFGKPIFIFLEMNILISVSFTV